LSSISRATIIIVDRRGGFTKDGGTNLADMSLPLSEEAQFEYVAARGHFPCDLEVHVRLGSDPPRMVREPGLNGALRVVTSAGITLAQNRPVPQVACQRFQETSMFLDCW